jgi:hypothetical protein
MRATDLRPAEPKAERRWLKWNRHKLFVLLSLLVVSGVWFACWTGEVSILPLSWTADYDKDRYIQICTTIETDEHHLLGKSLVEVSKELGLDDVSWSDGYGHFVWSDKGGIPSRELRVYHFRGFALYVTLELLPLGFKPGRRVDFSDAMEIHRHGGVLWLGYKNPRLEIDGIGDPTERWRRLLDAENARERSKIENRHW